MRIAATTLMCLSLVMFAGGCNSEAPTTEPQAAQTQVPAKPSFQGIKLKVAALEDPAMAQIAADLIGEWQASTGGEVEIITNSASGAQGEIDPAVDIWLVRGQKLGELIDKDSIEPLGDLNADWTKRPPVFESMVTRYGPDRFGVPLGTRMLVLVYRESTFKSPANIETMKQAGLVFPPRTWDDFDKLVAALKKSAPGVLALPTMADANDHLSLDIFLARATATGKHRDHFSFLFSSETMEPRIAGVPFSDSLIALAALKPPGNLTPSQARAAFRDGQANLLIDYAENASKWARPEEQSKIGVVALPGSLRVFEPDRKAYDKMESVQPSTYLPGGGGYLAVLARGRKKEFLPAAKDLLVYLASDSTAISWAADQRMTLCPTRDAMLAAGFVDPRIAPKVEGGAWGEAVLSQITGENPVVGLRIPQSAEFLAELESAVIAGLGGKPAGAELEIAAKKWKQRVGAFGPQRLKWHYRRSLVRPVTDAKAPPPGQ